MYGQYDSEFQPGCYTRWSSTDPTLSGGDPEYMSRPKSWILKGTNDDANDWTDGSRYRNRINLRSIYGDVYSRSDSPASYQYYKLSVTVNNGGSGLKIGEWQLWGDA